MWSRNGAAATRAPTTSLRSVTSALYMAPKEKRAAVKAKKLHAGEENVKQQCSEESEDEAPARRKRKGAAAMARGKSAGAPRRIKAISAGPSNSGQESGAVPAHRGTEEPFVTTGLWLMKNEPSELSLEILQSKACQTWHWDGVRGYQARNHLRRMKVGDRALFYYSSCKVPGIAGIIKVVNKAYPDHTAWDPKSAYFDPKSTPDAPKWDMVDVQFEAALPRYLPLDELRKHKDGRLAGMQLFTHFRLSIQPLSQQHWDALVALASEPPP